MASVWERLKPHFASFAVSFTMYLDFSVLIGAGWKETRIGEGKGRRGEGRTGTSKRCS